MKMIVAVIKPENFNQVKRCLYHHKIYRFMVTDCYGHSDEEGVIESYRGVPMEVDLVKKVRIQIAVNDGFVDTAVKAILEGGKSGDAGDGKIFVYPLDQCYRISTGEEGSDAIGGEI